MFLRNELVLVTGASGLVGRSLIDRLKSEGAKIRATLHRRNCGATNDGIEYIVADLTRREDCERAVAGMRYVFHCAANSGGAAVTLENPIGKITANLVMNSQMLDVAYAARVDKFVWLGSTTAYPPSNGRAVKEDEIWEGEPYSAYFFIGWEKRMMELLCRMYGEKLSKPMTIIVLRPTNIYGPNDEFDPARSRVTAALIKKVVERHNPVVVWGTGEDVRDLIYVDDVVDAMLLAIETVDKYEAFNVGSGQGVSVKVILKQILEIERCNDATIIFDQSKPAMIPIRLVDTTRARSRLGFTPKTELMTGLRRTIEWYKHSTVGSVS
jgi:GDP-L-fucose synthase